MKKVEIKNYLQFICACLPTVKEFYRGEIKGINAYEQIIPLALTHYENDDYGFNAINENLLSQINVNRFYSKELDLPMHSSGSFYTALTDLDFIYTELTDMDEAEIDEMVSEYEYIFNLIK